MGIKSLDLNHHTVRSVEVPPKDILYSKKIQSQVMVYGYENRERRPLPQVWESVVDARIDSQLVVGDWNIIQGSVPLPFEGISHVVATENVVVAGYPGIKVVYARDMGSIYPDLVSYFVGKNDVVVEILMESKPSKNGININRNS